MSYQQSTCKKCGKAIVWLKTPAGKWTPADAGPLGYRVDPDGPNLLLDDRGRAIRCQLTEDHPDGYGRRSHFATCPEADSFRRRDRG